MKEAGHTEPSPQRIAYLIEGFLKGTLNSVEHDELDVWIEASEANMRLFEELTDEDKLEAAQAFFIHREAQKKQQQQRYAGIKKNLGIGSKPLWIYGSAAALVALCFGIYWLNTNGSNGAERSIAKKEVINPALTMDKPLLTLSDGRTIYLDSARNGLDLGEVQIDNNQLLYTSKAMDKEGFNTLTVPRGSQYRISLSDGTQVWLNCESSLTYPVTFNGTERKVELHGEGYFEVARDAKKIFTVVTGAQRVTVLGTYFNVAGYKGENFIKTTLLEGKVKIDYGLSTVVLKPGEQALSNEKGIGIKDVDVTEEVAWKNGLFLFRNAPIESIGAQIQRWYGVKVEYRGKVKAHFNATVPRKEKLERLLSVLEGSGFVHFTLDKNILVIQP